MGRGNNMCKSNEIKEGDVFVFDNSKIIVLHKYKQARSKDEMWCCAEYRLHNTEDSMYKFSMLAAFDEDSIYKGMAFIGNVLEQIK